MGDFPDDLRLTPDSFDLNVQYVGGPYDGRVYVWPEEGGGLTDGDTISYAGVPGYYVYHHRTEHGHDDRLWYVDHELDAGPDIG